ncbi:peptidoglycan-binding protein [Candidatus Kaiserbacteria bacterium]|nr:peptidoglycan-binding protein [Candidatus Kaiserbacteria bacterium]
MQYTLRSSALLALIAGMSFLLLPKVGLAGQVLVSMTDYQFEPQSVTINPGDTVVWVNNSNLPHAVVSDDGTLSSGTIAKGQTFAAFYGKIGTYFYHDQYYGNAGGGGMAGTINVTAAASIATPAYAPTYATAPTYYTPTTSGNPSIAQLQAQIQTVLAQIQALQGSVAGTGPAGTVTTSSAGAVKTYAAGCPQIGRSLKSGDSGDDVSRLQQFLARDSAVYPDALVTGYYGALTQSAVQRWQAKFNIVSSGTPDSTGYGVVGPRTAAAISIICAGGSINGISGVGGPSSSPVGGFISVTPITGLAPLSVNVSATVNTTGSCAGATYTLDFGDATPVQTIPVAAGNCGQLQQTYQHIYQFGGTYRIVLSAGSHSTTATITVTGPGASAGVNASTPAGTISSFVTSGTAPLTVTFYVSCVAGVAYDVIFGDGQDLGGANVGKTSCNGDLQAVTHTYTSAGLYQAQLILFVTQQDGTITSQSWGTVQVSVTGTQPSSSTTSNYSTPVLQSGGGSSLAFTLQFDLPSSCTGYDVSWGDGSSHVTQNDGGSSCAQGTVTKTLSHTYASSGSYTIVVMRGPTLARSDDVSITINQ